TLFVQYHKINVFFLAHFFIRPFPLPYLRYALSMPYARFRLWFGRHFRQLLSPFFAPETYLCDTA
ncbi:MAG: hypothetical protein ACI4TW_00345, partial [Prevotella sp.]